MRGSEIENYNFVPKDGIQKGYQQEQEMKNEIKRRGIKAPTRGSAASGHGRLNKRAPGAKELDELARISYLANAQFGKGLFTQIWTISWISKHDASCLLFATLIPFHR